MKLTEKMIEIVKDRVAGNQPMSDLLGVSATKELLVEQAIKGLESIPIKNIEEARLMLAEKKAKLLVYNEDSREYGEAFHTSQHIANLIDIIEEAEG